MSGGPENRGEVESAARLAFTSAFGRDASVVAIAPSRVELLGNHTDYNGGLVLAAAIDRFTCVVGRPSPELEALVVASDFRMERDSFRFNELNASKEKPDGWRRYVRGVTWAMQNQYPPIHKGFDIAIAGNVPLGAGLSSSASLQAALAVFLLETGAIEQANNGDIIYSQDKLRFQLAQTLQLSENEYVGVNSGLLDQFSVLLGKANHALMLDCRTGEFECLPLGDPAPAIVVCDSKTSRSLADGMYNQRREECERVVSYFQPIRGDRVVTQLRDITVEELRDEWQHLDPVGRARAHHVLSENDRVRRGALALKSGDIATFGKLMSASHDSSRSHFQNSSFELDALVESAQESPGFLGGKLSGAGWAGCTVNLVQAGREGEFAESVRAEYTRRTGISPIVHICRAADGASATSYNGGT
jgi:galactokinase